MSFSATPTARPGAADSSHKWSDDKVSPNGSRSWNVGQSGPAWEFFDLFNVANYVANYDAGGGNTLTGLLRFSPLPIRR